MLINGDKYGSVGKENELMLMIAQALRKILSDLETPEISLVEIAKQTIKENIESKFNTETAKSKRIKLFFEDINKKILNIEDVKVFIVACENILLPINKAMSEIPNNDLQYTETVAKAYLDTRGEEALATVIGLWDDTGVEGCLNAERIAVVREFGILRRDMDFLPESEQNMVLTAFTQEFERRLSQKRKSRAGGSLENVIGFLINYYKIPAANAPDHFQADIEVDKWIKCKDKWFIGISCKRTIRERWKQVSSATGEVLSKFKIREMWHLVTYDEDLSDDKLALLGGFRHIFYLQDASRRLEECCQHDVLRNYVRPMSQFIRDLKRFTK
jgi:hypothetical protein